MILQEHETCDLSEGDGRNRVPGHVLCRRAHLSIACYRERLSLNTVSHVTCSVTKRHIKINVNWGATVLPLHLGHTNLVLVRMCTVHRTLDKNKHSIGN